MAIIPLAEYARQHGKTTGAALQIARKEGFKTAYKPGRDWLIDEDEPYPDRRVKSGKYVGWRKGGKVNDQQGTNPAGDGAESSD